MNVLSSQRNGSGDTRFKLGASFAILALLWAMLMSSTEAVWAAQIKIGVVSTRGASLHEQPAGRPIATLIPGETVEASARNPEGDWVLVWSSDEYSSAIQGWVAVEDLIIFGVMNLPVAAAEMLESVLEAGAAPSAPSNSAPITPTASITLPTAAALSALLAPSEPTATPSSRATQPTHVTVEVVSTELNVRAAAGANQAILHTLRQGEQVLLLTYNTDASWAQVALADGSIGWVNAAHIRDTTQNPPPATSTPVATHTPAAPPASNEPSRPTASTNPLATATGLQGSIVFSSGNGGLFYHYDLASGAVRPLTHGYDPALSPDGQTVAFTRGGGESGLYVINSDGSGERKLFSEQSQLSAPKWSPDGEWIVFSRLLGTYKCRDLGRNDMCVSVDELLGSIPSGLSEEEEAAIKAIRGSVLSNFDEQVRPNWGLSRVNANGGDFRDLAALNSALAADWNEAGIVYQSKAGLEITADQGDATTRSLLADHYLHDPDWQPGGGQIVYQQRRGSRWEIFSVNPDGSGNHVLTQPYTTLVEQMPSNVAPAWSPDGQHIVFLSNRAANHEAGAWRIWVMNADGSNQRPLPVEVPIEYNFVQEQMVSWGG